MDIRELKLLKDILDCVHRIEDYIGDKKTYEAYVSNPLLQDAVERNIITIGEAMSALLKINSSIDITNARRIVDARNKLTHGYDEIEIVQIWSIIIRHLPILRIEVSAILDNR